MLGRVLSKTSRTTCMMGGANAVNFNQIRTGYINHQSNKTTRVVNKKHRHQTLLRELYQQRTHVKFLGKMKLSHFALLPRPQVIESESIDYMVDAAQYAVSKKNIKKNDLIKKMSETRPY